MFDAQDQYPWKPPTTTVQYVPGRGVARYKSALKTLIPIRKNKKRKVIGVDSAGFLSFISYSWMNELMLSAYRKATITVNELPHCSPWDTCSYNSERLDKMWQEEVARKGPQDASLGGVVWRFIRTRILFATFIYSLYVAMGFASPVSLPALYAANDLDTMFDAQDQYPWKPPTTTVQYVPGRGVARYKSALKTLIPIRKNKKCNTYGLSKLTSHYRGKTYSTTDERIKIISEVISFIKLIKMYAWEKNFARKLDDTRRRELEYIKNTSYFQSLGLSIGPTAPVISAITSFVAHIASGNNLTASQLINLFSNDSQRIYDMTLFAPLIAGGPLTLLLGGYYIYWLLSPWALSGILVFIIFYPVQYGMAEDEDGMLPKLEPEIKLEAVSTPDVHAMASDVIHDGTATRLRAACMGLLYKKVIRLNSLGNKSVGELINLFSNDSQRIYDMTLFAPLIAGGPLTLLLGGYYIYWLLSPWALSGILVFIIFYPVQYGLSKLTSHYRGKTYSTTDERIKIISEVISFIKLIKMYAWEKNFARKLDDTRRRELEYIKNTSYFQSLGLSIGPTAPVISAITSFVAHIASGNNLTASQSILLMEEVNVYVSKPIDKSSAVSIAGGSFLWDTLLDGSKTSGSKRKKYAAKSKEKSNGEESTHLKAEDVERNIALVDINFFAPKGKLVGICGAVGSGKSALLYAILSQLRSTAGKLSREGTCAYVSQEAWITNDTLRHNILFGEPFEPQRYYKTLYNCALNTDIHILPGGDQTEIGERGINLSGGQKQRVALARALYSNSILLMEEVNVYVSKPIDKSSAVSIAGGSFLWDTLLDSSKTSGSNIAGGSFLWDTLLDGSKTSGSNWVKHDIRVTNVNITEVQGNETVTYYSDHINANPDFYMYQTVYASTIGIIILTSLLRSFIFTKVITLTSTCIRLLLHVSDCICFYHRYHYTYQSTTELYIHQGNNSDFYMYQTVYASTIGIIILTSLLRSFIFTKVALKASHTLHAVLFKKMLYSPLSFFEETPSGRIQNYFTKDMFEVDSRLPYSLESSIQNMWSMLFAFLMICFVFPWFALPLLIITTLYHLISKVFRSVYLRSVCRRSWVFQNMWSMLFAFLMICFVFPWFALPLLIITTLYHLISKVFRIAVRELKRMENVSRSPIFSNVSSTVSGLHIIHVFHKEQDFVRRFCEQYDENSTTLFLCSMAMRWLAVRIDVLAVIAMAIITGLTVAFHGSVSPALAGLALTYASHVTGLLQFTVRVFVETELNFLAVERINNCSKKLVPEGRGPITSEFGQVKVKLADWPRQGTIKFKNVSLRYRDNWPLVLANVSFRINHGENIGIVGRTGAGKSSLLVALFRLVELSSGQIKIDDFDIASVELETLRSRLSVIPQDPVLFNGTIRYNLDPFGRCHDTELWDALEKSHLKSKVVTMRSKLDSDVQGDQLSLGEKQLLCLARALLRKTKILVLDEATASIDPETEMAIQSTIHLELRHCTVLLIAHRLSTVTSCDKVLVMDNGQVSEFDTPGNLLANPNTKFSQLMAAAQNNRGNVPL
ncbi:multidrug resistance-associated protein 9-like [Diaphorina citri]|uniref:Multidrug resistance-associated protein 9-like n=1 Tax=Diaphorina citri TaxID=121845 RepID=A0A3Q0IYC3_DIACI|nr:multidrug resistance-associated protein 9-like [Diaphorina citri]